MFHALGKNSQNHEFLKNLIWYLRQTPSKMCINDMVTIVEIFFEIVGGGGGL